MKKRHQPRLPLLTASVLFVTISLMAVRLDRDASHHAAAEQRQATVASQEKLTATLPGAFGDHGSGAIAAKDLVTGETYSFHDNLRFNAASTSKVLIGAYLYHQASDKKLKLDDMVTVADSEIQEYGTGSIRNDPPPHQYSYRELAKRMLNVSDNTAAHVLGLRLGLDNIQKFGTDTVGMTTYSATDNTMTPKDMLVLLDKVYANDLAEPSLTKEMLGFMKDTAYEMRMPAHLPPGTEVFHKGGDAEGGSHDVGIVKNGNHVYAAVIFTQNIPGEGLDEHIANASKDLYDYMVRHANRDE